MKKCNLLLILTLLLTCTALKVHAKNTDPLFIVHFETGPAWQKNMQPHLQPGFNKHAMHLQNLRENGVITFGARYQQFGMLFLKANSMEAATAILNDDPGITSGLFVYRIAKLNVFYPWQANIKTDKAQ